MSKIWNMASWRHRQQPRKYNSVRAIGEPRDTFETIDPDLNKALGREMIDHGADAQGFTQYSLATCDGCGYHVCSCEKPKRMLCEFVDGVISPVSGNFVRCHPHGQVWDRLMPDAGCGLCREEKRASLQADMQPVPHRSSRDVASWVAPESPAAPERRCDHTGIGLPGCEICDPVAKTRQRIERVSSASSCLAGKDQGTRQELSVSMGSRQTSAESGINQTREVIFEGRPLRVGDQVCAISMPQVVCTVEAFEDTRCGIYLTLSQPGTRTVGGYTASNWTRVGDI